MRKNPNPRACLPSKQMAERSLTGGGRPPITGFYWNSKRLRFERSLSKDDGNPFFLFYFNEFSLLVTFCLLTYIWLVLLSLFMLYLFFFFLSCIFLKSWIQRAHLATHLTTHSIKWFSLFYFIFFSKAAIVQLIY